MRRRVAYSVVPESGGLFRFYKNLRKALANYDWDVRAVGVGSVAAARWDHSFADEGCHLIAEDTRQKIEAAMALVQWIEQNRINILIPMDDPVAGSCVPHLPASIRLVTRCSSATAFAYRISAIYPQRLAGTVVNTPRQKQGLLAQGIPETKIALIPHGVDTELFSSKVREKEVGRDPIRITYIGRLDHQTKGILLLPLIAEQLKETGVLFSMEVFGDGPDRRRLEKLIAKVQVSEHVRLHGTVTDDVLARRLPDFDCLLVPSFVEGFGFALVEAMSAGVIPLVSHLPNVTDFVINHGENGFLCEVDNAASFVESILLLHADRSRQIKMAHNARKVVEDRFSLDRMGADYNHFLNAILRSSPTQSLPLTWSAFNIHPAYRGSMLSRMPRPVINVVKRLVNHRAILK